MAPSSRETAVDQARDSVAPLPPRYRVTRRIAAGGMGMVWAAQDELLRRPVAVKVLAENLVGQERFVERFEREARMAASLCGHPNVLTIYDVGEHQGRPFIVMEYLSGGTVADRLRGTDTPARLLAVSWLSQAAAALDFAHERGVVHRDVKPPNLLFDDRGRLAIADFGIARAAYEKTLTGTGELLGTAAYISPEQARGGPGSAASDRYSLAVVAYELLTRQRPFGGKDFVAQAIAHIDTEPRPASELEPDLPSAVDEVLEHGLAKDPKRRWPSASAFVEALSHAVEPAASSVQSDFTGQQFPASPQPRAGTSTRTRPTHVAPRQFAARRAVPVVLVVLAAIATGLVAAIALTGDGSRATRDAAKGQATGKREQSQDSSPGTRTESKPDEAVSVSEAARLNDEGFRLMRAGRHQQAIPLLERAVAAFPENSTDLTYAYALYNLGRSLRLAGRPQEAIPLLERRLRIKNQRDTVARELRAVRRAAGVGE